MNLFRRHDDCAREEDVIRRQVRRGEGCTGREVALVLGEVDAVDTWAAFPEAAQPVEAPKVTGELVLLETSVRIVLARGRRRVKSCL